MNKMQTINTIQYAYGKPYDKMLTCGYLADEPFTDIWWSLEWGCDKIQ